jgi:DNA-binding NtrC family response regulator
MNAARILCVDDDSRINELNLIALTRAGYEVEVAASPDAALERFREGTFDLVITDLFASSSSDAEFIAKIRHLSPSVPIILVTGDHNPPAEILQQTDAYVEKAYSLRALTDSVREVLIRGRLRRIV